MATQRPIHLFTLVGGKRDACAPEDRGTAWRPTLALVEHYRPTRIELLTVAKFVRLAHEVAEEFRQLSPGVVVTVHPMDPDPLWDFADNYVAILDIARRCRFDEDEDLLVHISNGPFPAQSSLFLLTRSRHLPGRLVYSSDRRVRDPFMEADLQLARYDAIAERFAEEAREGGAFLKQGIVTLNATFNRMIEEVEKVVTRSKAPLLLIGPTGCGKTALARRIYALLLMRGDVTGPFIEVNCATLRGDQALTKLFGYDRGAFTGAVEARQGALRRANGGVLFLDEIGELGPEEQAMLLTALDTKKVQPLGSDHEFACDFRLIAGTNRDLYADKRFREDLLARIDLLMFRMPSLRDRLEDLEPNIAHELERLTRLYDSKITFSREAYARFLDFAREAAWPHNFRDLCGSIERMTIFSGGRITEADVEREVSDMQGRWLLAEVANDGGTAEAPAWPPSTPRVDAALGAAAAEVDLPERVMLEAVLDACARSKNASEAGRLLYARARAPESGRNAGQRVNYLLKKYGIDPARLWR